MSIGSGFYKNRKYFCEMGFKIQIENGGKILEHCKNGIYHNMTM